jgi:hypothetical protein
MRILTFQAKRFAWKAFSQTIEGAVAPDSPSVAGEVEGAVVAFLHAEAAEAEPEQRKRAFKHTLKHLKWLANKRDLRTVVLHSFTHLGAENAPAEVAQGLIEELRERLEGTGYSVATTPFGWFCEWELSVYGESLAKVWKQV